MNTVDLNPPKTIPMRLLGANGEVLMEGASAVGQAALFRLMQRGELSIREVEQGKVPDAALTGAGKALAGAGGKAGK